MERTGAQWKRKKKKSDISVTKYAGNKKANLTGRKKACKKSTYSWNINYSQINLRLIFRLPLLTSKLPTHTRRAKSWGKLERFWVKRRGRGFRQSEEKDTLGFLVGRYKPKLNIALTTESNINLYPLGKTTRCKIQDVLGEMCQTSGECSLR